MVAPRCVQFLEHAFLFLSKTSYSALDNKIRDLIVAKHRRAKHTIPIKGVIIEGDPSLFLILILPCTDIYCYDTEYYIVKCKTSKT